MAKYQCTVCDYIFDEAKGDPEHKIKPGTRFADLPENWACPVCGAPKNMFKKI
jgi:rubredoxin